MAKLPNITIQTIQANGKVVGEQVFSSKNITLDALDNSSFKLIDETGKSPDSIITQKQGDDLVIKLSNQANQPTITINDFYSAENSQLVGTNASGELYPYNLASSNVETNSLLAEHVVTSESSFAFNPWYVLGGAVAVGGVALAAGGGGGGGSSSGGSDGSSSDSGSNSGSGSVPVSTGYIYTYPYISFDLYDRNDSVLDGNLQDWDAYNALPKELMFSIGSASAPKNAVVIKDGTIIKGSLDKYEKYENTDFYASREKINSTKNSSVDFKVKVDFKDGKSVSKNYKLSDYDNIKDMIFTDDNEILFFNKPISDGTTVDLKGGYDALIYDSEAVHDVNNFSLKANILESHDMSKLNFFNSKFEVNFSQYLKFGDLTDTSISGKDLTMDGKNATRVEINIADKYTNFIENDIGLQNVSDSRIRVGSGNSDLAFNSLKNSTIEAGAGDDKVYIRALNNVEGNTIDGGSGSDTLVLDSQVWGSSNKLNIDSSQFKNFEWVEAGNNFKIELKYSDLVADTGRDGNLNIIFMPGPRNIKSEIVFAEPEKWQKQEGAKTIDYKMSDQSYDNYPGSNGIIKASFDKYHYVDAHGTKSDVFIDHSLITNII